jgi:hypothetical protein
MSDVKVGQLWFGLGFDVDQVKLNDVVNSIGKLNLNSVLAAVGVGALVDGLKDIMDVASQITEPMYKFNAETGLSAQRMQQWSEYAQKFGVAGDVVSSSLAGLQKKMAAMKFGDSSLLSGIYLLQQAGADINQSDLNDPFSFLQKATVGLQKIKPELRTYVAGLLGLNEQVLLLKNGFQGADQMPFPSEEQVKAIRDYNSAWTMVGINLKQIFVDIASQYAPDLQNLGNMLNSWGEALHRNAAIIRPLFEYLFGLVALATALINPWLAVGYVFYMVFTHLKQLSDLIPDLEKKLKSIGIVQAIQGGFNLANKAANAIAPGNVANTVNSALGIPNGIFAAASGGGKHVTQQNSITIIAHNIEDLEHKFVAFMEKTIAKSFYQNSANY